MLRIIYRNLTIRMKPLCPTRLMGIAEGLTLHGAWVAAFTAAMGEKRFMFRRCADMTTKDSQAGRPLVQSSSVSPPGAHALEKAPSLVTRIA